jgi:hypothetical protein
MAMVEICWRRIEYSEDIEVKTMHMGSPVKFLMAGVFAVVAGGCVYVPPEYYYGSHSPRPYYVEEVRQPVRPQRPYRQQYWNRNDVLDREAERGYRDERRGRARQDRFEDRYAYDDDDDDDDRGDYEDDRRASGSGPGPAREPRSADRRETAPEPGPAPRSAPPKLAQPPTQDKKEILTGTKTKNPDRVKSPYAPYNELDVAGMASGSLARDPTTGRVFRVP